MLFLKTLNNFEFKTNEDYENCIKIIKWIRINCILLGGINIIANSERFILSITIFTGIIIIAFIFCKNVEYKFNLNFN